MVNGSSHEQKKWRKSLAPHWDIKSSGYSHWLSSGHYTCIYQGVLALSDQRLKDGTHLTLPGCINFLSKWCQLNEKENTNPHRHTINKNNSLMKYMQPILLRKGEIMIWNYGQLHANTQNLNDRSRLSIVSIYSYISE